MIRKKTFSDDPSLTFLMDQEITIEASVKRTGTFAYRTESQLTIRHLGSYLSVTVGVHRSQHKNLAQALLELNQLLADKFGSPSNVTAAPSPEIVFIAENLDVVRRLKSNNGNVKLTAIATGKNVHIVQKLKSELKKVPLEVLSKLT